jgi:hypothetical protein
MDHHEQHHQHHQKQREEKKRHHKKHERGEKGTPYPIHPQWLLFLAIALILAAVLIWTFLIP